MNLTPAQKATTLTWLNANASGLSDQAAADALNASASGPYFVWRSIITRDEVQAAVAFDWTRVDNLSVGKARIWDWMFNKIDAFRPWRGNIRAGINAVWIGTAPDLAVKDAVNAACQRPATVFEKLFVTATTTGPAQTGNRGLAANADTLGLDAAGAFIDGMVTAQFVADIRAGL